ncbi:PHD finger-containing protein 6 [Cardamine amara subsp. amara]|uniref:PHD finger-containing protein 6 n=1 Tax=Cardamine amara subsp. amara TaxID=228776 RepID=A0ABD1B8H3_CARAN
MGPGIKEVPGRSNQRVESSNPVPRGNPTPKTSKVMLISPEEAMKLTSGGNEMLVSPVAESSKPNTSHVASQVPKPVSAHQTPETSRPVPSRANSEVPKPVSARRTPETPRPVPARPTTEASRPVLATSAAGSRKEIICGLEAWNVTTPLVRKKIKPSLHQPKTDEPPSSPRALQIRSRVKQQAPNATQVVQEILEVGDKAKDHGFKEIRQSVSDEELTELLEYLPSKDPTWKGRIVDSATPLKFDCDFWATSASTISKKAHELSKAMPALLKVELLPTHHIPNDVSDRCPSLLNVQMYLFPDENITERFKGEHAHLFEAIATHNAKVDINGSELLIFSSKLLDKTSQFVISTQKKTENFLWGFFPKTINSQELGPGTAHQIDKDLDCEDVVMDIDTECPTPSVALNLLAKSQSTPSKSLEELNREASVPPGFEKLWAPPFVKLNVQGTSKMGFAGIVLNQSGKWVFGYAMCHKNISEVAAGILAIYHGLKILWDGGFRRIQLETTSREVITALTTKSVLFPKKKTILGSCKDMILKEWECNIYVISKEQNSCAEWLASSSRLEEQLQEFIFFDFPPRGLIDFMEENGLAAII